MVTLGPLRSSEPRPSLPWRAFALAASLAVLTPFGAPLPAEAEAGETSATIKSVTPTRVGFGETITVDLDHLSSLLDSKAGDCQQLILYLNGLPLLGTHPLACDLDANRLVFTVERVADARAAWISILGQKVSFHRMVKVTVGRADGALAAGSVAIELAVTNDGRFWSSLAIAFVILASFIYFARASDVLRDRVKVAAPARPPYSLARSQMAFWTMLVMTSFLVVWGIAGTHDTLPASVLILMGISSGTAMGAAVAQPPAGASAAAAQESEGFLTDILSDQQGVSFHRFQLFGWTIVLGLIFIWSVVTTLSMPDFNTQLLALVGISSGTYMGFKLQGD